MLKFFQHNFKNRNDVIALIYVNDTLFDIQVNKSQRNFQYLRPLTRTIKLLFLWTGFSMKHLSVFFHIIEIAYTERLKIRGSGLSRTVTMVCTHLQYALFNHRKTRRIVKVAINDKTRDQENILCFLDNIPFDEWLITYE